jgi:hypothetical protein
MKKQRHPNLRESYMDGEKLFRKYFEMGDARSIPRLQLMVKQDTGIEPSLMGVWKSMWRWASLSENRDTAWQIYQRWDGSLSYDAWVADMRVRIRRAWQHPTDAKYNKFLRENGWV